MAQKQLTAAKIAEEVREKKKESVDLREVEEIDRALQRLKERVRANIEKIREVLEIEFSELAPSECADLVDLRLEKYTAALSELPFFEFQR